MTVQITGRRQRSCSDSDNKSTQATPRVVNVSPESQDGARKYDGPKTKSELRRRNGSLHQSTKTAAVIESFQRDTEKPFLMLFGDLTVKGSDPEC